MSGSTFLSSEKGTSFPGIKHTSSRVLSHAGSPPPAQGRLYFGFLSRVAARRKKRLLLMRWFGAGSSPTYLRRTLTNRFETLFPRGTRFRRHDGTRLERGGEVKDSSALPLSSVGRSVISRFLSIIPLARTRERNPNSSCAIHCIYDIVYYSRISYSLESGAKHLDSNGITRAKDGRISALLHGCIVSTGLEVTTFRPSRYICINCLEGDGGGEGAKSRIIHRAAGNAAGSRRRVRCLMRDIS